VAYNHCVRGNFPQGGYKGLGKSHGLSFYVLLYDRCIFTGLEYPRAAIFSRTRKGLKRNTAGIGAESPVSGAKRRKYAQMEGYFPKTEVLGKPWRRKIFLWGILPGNTVY
jgi:hypothetical protein